MSGRTFRIPPDAPLMRGSDIAAWQDACVRQFRAWGITVPDPGRRDGRGVYGAATRLVSRQLCIASGVLHESAMSVGVSPELRVRLRNQRLTLRERVRKNAPAAVRYRRALRRRGQSVGTAHPLLTRVLADSNDFSAGHNGIDLISDPSATVFAPTAGIVRRADTDGWWTIGRPANVRPPAGGVVIFETTTSVPASDGGIRIPAGTTWILGHCGPSRGVRVGSVLRAGDPVAKTGFANAWHIHLEIRMANGTTRGVGDRDPGPYYRRAQAARDAQ